MAAQKLLPPIIESKLPAQKGNALIIPFLHNRSVGENQYDRMVLKVKTISTNQEVGILYSDGKSQTFKFDENSIKLQVGQYYKAQLAYESNNLIGYYSTVGIFKYTALPSLTIWSGAEELRLDAKNTIGLTLYGHYANIDTTEKVYSYCFNIYKDNELLDSSGELLHAGVNDSVNESIDSYSFNYKLEELSTYKIEYKVITNNNLEATSPSYYISDQTEIPNSYNYNIETALDKEIGGVKIKMKMQEQSDIQGRFRLVRIFDDRQEILKEFTINDVVNEYFDLGVDLTVEHGKTYIYGIQQYNNDFMTEMIKSNPIFIDFEDVFLFDGKQQLKIKFNPKITSFKNTILESKLDTIGGQYPFVFRNGRVKYKEFPIAGLISYWMDNENLFTLEKKEYSTNLTSDNIALERNFKLQVLEWLNNGEPKLFRSPTEGNYIVRLMNVSLSPEETLGRMLHSFNCTAYEIAEFTYDNLKNYHLIPEVKNYNNLWRFYSIYDLNIGSFSINEGIWARAYGDIGSKYKLYFNDNTELEIQIGATGMYEIFCENKTLIKIELIELKSTILNLPYKIEYATLKAEVDTIKYNDIAVTTIISNERGAAFENSVEIISAITDNHTLILDNILFLRLSYIGTENGTSIVSYKYHNDDILHKIKFNQVETEITENEEVWYRTVAGRLELTAADFDGKFVLDELTIGENIRADIYYRVKAIN